MEKYGIINFNSASFTQKMIDCNYIKTILLEVEIDGESCKNNELKEMFDKVKKIKKIPKTSQPTSGNILEAYNKMLEKYEKVFILTPDKVLSGTHQNALLTIEMLENEELQKRLHVVQTRSFAISEAIVCDKLIDLIDSKTETEDILNQLDELSKKITTYIIPGSFDYLKMSGRVNVSQLIIGKLMVLKLLVRHKNGHAEVIQKTRGLKKMITKTYEEKESYENIEQIYFADILGDEKENSLLKEKLGGGTSTIKTSVVLGAHFGPGTLGFAIVGKESNNE